MNLKLQALAVVEIDPIGIDRATVMADVTLRDADIFGAGRGIAGRFAGNPSQVLISRRRGQRLPEVRPKAYPWHILRFWDSRPGIPGRNRWLTK